MSYARFFLTIRGAVCFDQEKSKTQKYIVGIEREEQEWEGGGGHESQILENSSMGGT